MNSTICLVVAIILSTMPVANSSAAQLPYKLTNRITQPDPDRQNYISRVNLTNDYLFVGARAWRIPGDAGQIFMYDVNGENLLHTFDDPTPESFGYGSVAIDGDHLAIVDAPESHGGPDQVHIYDTESRTLLQRLDSPIPRHGGFASGVVVSEDHIVVGAYALGSTFGPTYPARVFVFDAISGDLRHTFSPPDGIQGGGWGEAFDISGNTIAIGTPRDPSTQAILFDAQSGDRIGTIKNKQIENFDYLRIKDNRILLGKNTRDTYLLDTDSNLLHVFEFPVHDASGGLLQFSGANVLIGSFGSLSANSTVTPQGWLYDGTSGELIQHFNDAAPGDRFVSMTSNPSGNQIAFLKTFDREVLVYSRIPEPSSLVLSGIFLAAVFFKAIGRRSHCIEPYRLVCSSNVTNSQAFAELPSAEKPPLRKQRCLKLR